MTQWILSALLVVLAGCQSVPATRTLFERLDRAERMQDWAEIEVPARASRCRNATSCSRWPPCSTPA